MAHSIQGARSGQSGDGPTGAAGTGVTDFFAVRASRYDQTIRAAIPGYEALHAMVGSLLETIVTESDAPRSGPPTLLLSGVGTGAELATLAFGHPDWRFVAQDVSDAMLGASQRLVREAGLTERVTFHLGDVSTLPPDRTFVAATALLVSHFIPEDGKAAYFGGLASRLVPGGHLLTAERGRTEVDALFLEAQRRYKVQHGISEDEAQADIVRYPTMFHLLDEPALDGLLRSCGFDQVVPFFRAFGFAGRLARLGPLSEPVGGAPRGLR